MIRHRTSASQRTRTGEAAETSGRTMRLFVDGSEAATLDRPGRVNPSHFDLVIGGFATGSPAHFTGLVDEVRVFARALSADEIRLCWQASAPSALPPATHR